MQKKTYQNKNKTLSLFCHIQFFIHSFANKNTNATDKGNPKNRTIITKNSQRQRKLTAAVASSIC